MTTTIDSQQVIFSDIYTGYSINLSQNGAYFQIMRNSAYQLYVDDNEIWSDTPSVYLPNCTNLNVGTDEGQGVFSFWSSSGLAAFHVAANMAPGNFHGVPGSAHSVSSLVNEEGDGVAKGYYSLLVDGHETDVGAAFLADANSFGGDNFVAFYAFAGSYGAPFYALYSSDALAKISVGGDINSGTSFSINGTQVLSTPSSPITNPSGGSVIDAECRAFVIALADAARDQGWLES